MGTATDAAALAAKIEALYRGNGLLESGIFATAAQWQTLLEHPHAGRIALYGLYKLRTPPNLRTVSEQDIVHQDPVHEEIADRLCQKYGVTHTFFGIGMSLWAGTEDESWDFYSVSEFPSRDSLVAFMMEPDWIRVCQNRVRTLAKHRSYAVRLPSGGAYLH